MNDGRFLSAPLSVLDAFAGGARVEESVRAHVDICAACSASVEAARAVNTFLARVRPFLAAPAGTGPAPESTPESLNPDLVSGYQIQEEVHRGGQGVVYRAVQTRTRRTVAIKMLLGGHAATGRRKERFEREVRIAAGLRHANIVTVHDSGYIGDGRYGLVMEYIDGLPLDRWSRSLDEARGRDARRRALRTRLGVMAKVCDAVLCAHQHSIVHRDLKPGNILVDSAGEPHVLDFGIARDTGPEQHTRLTYTGEFAGTLAYASPEQVSGDLSRVDTRTDIYSLGVLMYEMVSGRMPYAVDGPMSRVIRSIESAEPVPLPRVTRDPEGPWVDGEVSTIILKAMSKDPARRYQTAAALRDDITRYLAGHAIEARRDSTWYILRKTAARHRIIVSAAALIVLLLAAFGAAMAWQSHRLAVRGRELAGALSNSNIERGRSLAAAGDPQLGEGAVWPELIRAGVTRIDGPELGFSGSPEALQAYWALWDIFQRSRRVARFETHHKRVCLLYFDESGRRLSALDTSGNLVSWSLATWELVRDTQLVAPIDGTDFSFARSPDGDIAIFGGGVLRVMDPDTGRVRARLDDADGEAISGAFNPDGTLLATIGKDRRLRLRNVTSLATTVTVSESPEGGIADGFLTPAFSPDGRLVAAARPGGSLGLWSTSSGVLDRALQPPGSLTQLVRGGASTKTIAFGPDGTIASTLRFHVVVWPADGAAPLDLGRPVGAIMEESAFLPGSEGRILLASGSSVGGGGGVTVVWDLATRGRVATLKQWTNASTCTTSADGRLIAVGGLFGLVQVFEAAPEPHVRVLHPGSGRGGIAALSRDGRLVAFTTTPEGETGRDVLLMDVASGTTISRFHREGSPIRGLEFAADGLSLFESEESGRTMQWFLPEGTTGREFAFPKADRGESAPGGEPKQVYVNGGFNQIRLSPDGTVLARARDDGLIGLWDLPSGRWVGSLDSGAYETSIIDFSSDGKTLVAHHPEKCVLWDVRTRQPRCTIATDRYFPAVRCSPAGAVMAQGVMGCLRFMDTDTGRVLSESGTAGTAGMAMVFHPGGRVFFASAFDSSIRLWDTRTGRELLSLQKHTDLIRSLLLTPDGNTLISADMSGMVLAWDLTYYNDHIRRGLEDEVSHSAKP